MNQSQPKSWVEQNLKNIDCTLCWSSDSSILNYNGKHIIFHTVDRAILFLEKAMIINGKKGAIVYPVDERKIVVPMCVEALYSLYPSNSPKNKVLLISQNVAARELFWNLQANTMKLNNVFPLGIVKIDGQIKPQLKTSKQMVVSGYDCKFLHTSNPRILPDKSIAEKIGCLIIDTFGIETAFLNECINWSIQNKINFVIFLVSDPYSESFSLFEKLKIPIWGWNTDSLYCDFKYDLEEIKKNHIKYENPFSLSVYQIKNWLEGIKREFVVIDNPEITSTLNEMLQLYFDIKKICKETKNKALSESLITYVSCKYAFERMLAPLKNIEYQCRSNLYIKTLERRIEILKSLQKILSSDDPYFSGFWGKTYNLSSVMYNKFSEFGNPKYEKLKTLVKKIIENKEKILIFNYNEAYARALIDSLKTDFSLSEQDLERMGIFITSINDRHLNADYDKCVIFGQIPFRSSWLLRTACAKEILFFIYPSEKALLKQQFEREEKKFSDMFKDETRTNFLMGILEKNQLDVSPPAREFARKNVFSLGLTQTELKDEEKFKPLLADIVIDDTLIFDEDTTILDEQEMNETTISENGELVVKCCKITLDNNKVIYFRQTRKLPIFKSGNNLEYMDVKNVKPGEMLVVIKNNIRNNLAREIINCADNHPRMQRLKFLVNSWVVTLRKGMAENKDEPLTFLKKLNEQQELEKAIKVTNQLTIQLWRDGYVIGPRDNINIKLIGKIYNEKFLVDHYTEIGSAVTRLRGIHQKLLRDFNELIVKAGLKGIRSGIDEIIDEEFNLHLEDFIGIISIERIKKIDLDSNAQRSKLDKILRDEND